MNIPIAPGVTLTMDAKGTRTAEPTIQERIEAARKRRHELHIETVIQRQRAEICEKREAIALQEFERLSALLDRENTAPRPVMTEAQHNVFKGGRW